MESSPEFLAFQALVAGRYAVDREIGRGGMGVVFLARDVALERPVAIKLLLPHLADDPTVRERFRREAQTAAGLMHPNIVPIHTVEAHGDLVFFVMAYVDGETLTQRVARVGPLSAEHALRVMRDVAWALGYAHGRGVVHRDIKPDNILIEHSSGRAMVADFGIARVEKRDTLTADGAFVGTIQYMSPEQASAEPVDGRTDVYSLGATTYFALTGQAPVNGPTLPAILTQLLTEEPDAVGLLRSDLPPGFGELVMKALTKDRAARFESADHLATALQDADRTGPTIRPEVQGYLRNLTQLRVLVTVSALTSVVAPVLYGTDVVTREVALAIGLGGVGVGAYLTLMAAVGPLVALRRIGVTIDEVLLGVREEARATHETEKRMRAPSVMKLQAAPLGWLFTAMGAMNTAITTLTVLTKPWNRGWPLYATLAFSIGILAAGISLVRDRNGTGLLARMMMWRPNKEPAKDVFLGAIAWLLGLPLTRKLLSPIGDKSNAKRSAVSAAPTATLLLRRVEELVAQLPAGTRAQLGDAVPVAGALERANAALRLRLEAIDHAISELPGASPARAEFVAAREKVAARLAECAGALDQLRTDLLRLSAGLVQADGLTLAFEKARELGAAIDAELHGQAEVKKLLG